MADTEAVLVPNPAKRFESLLFESLPAGAADSVRDAAGIEERKNNLEHLGDIMIEGALSEELVFAKCQTGNVLTKIGQAQHALGRLEREYTRQGSGDQQLYLFTISIWQI